MLGTVTLCSSEEVTSDEVGAELLDGTIMGDSEEDGKDSGEEDEGGWTDDSSDDVVIGSSDVGAAVEDVDRSLDDGATDDGPADEAVVEDVADVD